MLTALALSLVINTGTPERPLPFVRSLLRSGHHFVVCAHRGDHLEATENSLEAYNLAAKDGADFGETDLRMTKDGHIVLMHDDTVDRTTNGHGRVADLTLAEIQALRFKKTPDSPIGVPTFEDLLKSIKGKLSIYMDIKAVHAKDVLPLLKKYKMEHDVIAYIYLPSQLEEWHRDAPGIPVIADLYSMKSVETLQASHDRFKSEIVDGGYENYTQEFIGRWHDFNVAVIPDIQGADESPAKWQPMIDMGVDGLQTDHPKQLITYLVKMGIR